MMTRREGNIGDKTVTNKLMVVPPCAHRITIQFKTQERFVLATSSNPSQNCFLQMNEHALADAVVSFIPSLAVRAEVLIDCEILLVRRLIN